VTGGANINRLTIDTLVSGTYFGTKIRADTISAVKLINVVSTDTMFTGDGDIWHDEDECAFETYTNNIRGTLNRCLFAQSNTVLCSNTVSETSLMGVDSLHTFDSLPVRWFKKGKRLRFGISGIYSTKATSPGNLIVRLKLNSTVIDSAIVPLDANENGQTWRMDGALICSDTGATGSIKNVTSFNHLISSGGQNVMHGDAMYSLGTTVNTTIKLKPNLTAQFSLADVANKIRSIVFYLEEIH
jgi:hypothetical protein